MRVAFFVNSTNLFSEMINLPEISSSSVSSSRFRMGREIQDGFCLGFRVWCVVAAKVDFECKLCKSIFDKGGTSDEIGLGVRGI